MTVAGSRFRLARLKKEVEDGRNGNQELTFQNHELQKELRRAGCRLTNLGN